MSHKKPKGELKQAKTSQNNPEPAKTANRKPKNLNLNKP